MNKTIKLVYAALFTAMAIIIPVYFGFLRVVIGPFTATLGSHIPIFLAMFISPVAAIGVGLGSTLGFFMAGLPAPVVARAAMHMAVGCIGALLIKRGVSFTKVMLITAPIHGGLEALAVIPFGWGMEKVLITVAVGTVIHHLVDGAFTGVFVNALSKAMRKDISKGFFYEEKGSRIA